jgi:hypothetical protein
MITVTEILPGVLQVLIFTSAYGQAGEHWRSALDGPNHNGYGKIYIQRYGANRRRYENCYDLAGYYKGCLGANIDECPGAMFIWSTMKDADIDAIDAIDNQALGRDLGNVLRPYRQRSEKDLWEVQFRFL